MTLLVNRQLSRPVCRGLGAQITDKQAGHPLAGRASRAAAALVPARLGRDRYGEEFAELLISDIEERPGSAGRALDVARAGLVARLTAAGLAGCPLPVLGGTVTAQSRYRHVGASLGSLGCVLVVFAPANPPLAEATMTASDVAMNSAFPTPQPARNPMMSPMDPDEPAAAANVTISTSPAISVHWAPIRLDTAAS